MMKCARISRALALLLSASLAAPAIGAAELIDAQAVLSRTDPAAEAGQAPARAPAAALMDDIVRFRTAAATMPPQQAAEEWMRLFDRAHALSGTRIEDFAALDLALGTLVGMRSVLAALPPPKAWPALRTLANAKAEQNPSDRTLLALRLLTDVLVQDHAASRETLAAIDKTFDALPRDERQTQRIPADTLRTVLVELYGDKDAIATDFEQRVETAGASEYAYHVEAPDLVGLLGEARATTLLRAALRQPVSLSIGEGDATRALARALAVEHVAELRRPQWQLVDSLDAVGLYEALHQRFDADAGSDDVVADVDYFRMEADAYYFVALVIAGRQEDAERALTRLAGGNSTLSIPRDVVQALQRSEHGEALYGFLHAALAKRPELDAWDVYLEQAAYTGHHDDALQRLDEIVARTDVPAFLRESLRDKRIDALLAADRVDPALALLREDLERALPADDDALDERIAAATRQAAVLRVLGRSKEAAPALDFAIRATGLSLKKNASADADPLRKLFAELRRQQREADAQALALAVFDQPPSGASADFAVMMPNPLRRAALVELAGLYDAAHRPRDVLALVDGAAGWGARDLKEIAAEKDSLGVPLGVMVARALAATGDATAAAAVVDAVLDRLPGHDGGYGLLFELHGERALALLDARYSRDPFEERPLIWKAIVLQKLGRVQESESAIRAAIAIDPSDGEQGRDDRMRAYAVLADLRAGAGDGEAAATYRGAVAAIRLSEQGDELHALGLYQRAFAAYRAALEKFSGAYCVQSRLAVQLSKRGLHEQALAHYRRAYELMPDSFGRVESHCFGCESVFQDTAAQGVAEEVFGALVKSTPEKPQAHYMLAYLRIEQHRYRDALDSLRQAVARDGDYLNAWKKLHELGEKTYIPAAERDIARLKLVELDPLRRHVQYDVSKVGDLRTLWTTLEHAHALQRSATPAAAVYPLRRNASEIDASMAKLPDAMREQAQLYFRHAADGEKVPSTPAVVLGSHSLFTPIAYLMGDENAMSH